MTKEKDTVTEATEELTESLREANRVIADSLVAAQERNWKFAQSVMEDEVDLFKSHTEGTHALMEKLMGEANKGPAVFQSVADSAVAAQEKNVQFVQGVIENGTEVLRSHVEGTRTLMQTLIDQSRKQREAFGVLARGTWDAYRGFFPSPFHYYERAMERFESMTSHGVETAHKMVHEERPVAHAAKK
ncbi:MAG TPA: hypothetical protein VEI53_07825 [Ktedonobacteraceae bacterium]|jgi:hypothetical protein|nr:hypothetical protein [Ktedonobacteraceae bacterium]